MNKEELQFILDVLYTFDSADCQEDNWDKDYKEKVEAVVDDINVNHKMLSVIPIDELSDKALNNLVKLMFLDQQINGEQSTALNVVNTETSIDG